MQPKHRDNRPKCLPAKIIEIIQKIILQNCGIENIAGE